MDLQERPHYRIHKCFVSKFLEVVGNMTNYELSDFRIITDGNYAMIYPGESQLALEKVRLFRDIIAKI